MKETLMSLWMIPITTNFVTEKATKQNIRKSGIKKMLTKLKPSIIQLLEKKGILTKRKPKMT